MKQTEELYLVAAAQDGFLLNLTKTTLQPGTGSAQNTVTT